MDLKDFIDSHPQIKEFDETEPSRHSEILSLLAKPMRLLGLHLAYERTPSFNALLKAQGLKFKTIVSLKKEKMTGLFSISSSPRFLNGIAVEAAYLGDFRIEGDLKIASFWRKNYGLALDLFTKEESLNKPSVFITAILSDNKQAQKSLVTNSKHKESFRYHFLRTVEMTNILAKLPVSRGSTGDYRVRYARKDEEFRVLDFIDQCEKEKTLGFDFKKNHNELWQQRKDNLPQFDITRFLIIENGAGEYKAVTLPWSPDSIKRMTLRYLARPMRLFFQALRWVGVRLPSQGETISTLYLTHLNLSSNQDAKKIIVSILNYMKATGISQNYHMISFANWWNSTWSEYLTYSVKVNLFEVTGPQMKPKISASAEELLRKPIGFEMALV